ncbi:cytochrome P450 [Streptomyces turgidiscabies]|uniref:Unspecific monooxygenase n=2 Tax=Streptomyces TaxID=1883 RepID=L7F1S4_STRT8|nr:cytochrome P450 [Streptomyces turgidiscabies]ELP65262.1 unspecific monooxygenase [Streptomyces turgidiscabies Car8]MDX3492227.1 cytochrome P450 [Streptomyces turgidiscabies]GAQ69482.1 pentalenene oxygenase [Streptomyces turgidiscabies]
MAVTRTARARRTAPGAPNTPAPVPGPTGRPLLGSALDLRRDPLGTFVRAQREYGDVIRMAAGPPGLRTVMYCVFSPEGAQQVLATRAADFRKDNVFYEEIRQTAGNGLLTSQDDDYLRQRRLIQPLFTKKRVDGYATTITREAEATAERWRNRPEVDVVREMDRLALRTVTRVLFGADVEAAVDVVHANFPVISAYITGRAYSPLRLPRTWPTPSNRRAQAATREVYEVCDRIIATRRSDGTGTDDQGDDLLSLLSGAQNDEDGSLDATELRDQVLVFLLAGHETTATSLAFALRLLARHPEVRARAHAEIDALPPGEPYTAATVDRLPYLTRILKETMRLYPAAPLMGRRAVADTEIDGHVVPAGADVLISPWVTHRHPAHWDDPDRFDPDRFTPDQESARHRYAWLPFGGGPRACIGRHFSMLESVLALAVLLREYDVESPATEMPVTAAVTLQAVGEGRVGVRARR